MQNIADPFGEISDIQSDWIIANTLNIQVQKRDGTVRKGEAFDINPGDFVEAEMKLGLQLIMGRNGQKQARVKFNLTRLARLCSAKDVPRKKVQT